MRKILFVCLGNICRSPLAHALFEEAVRKRGLTHRYAAESAGTSAYHVGEEADARMRATAAAHGLVFSHKARQLQPEDLEEYDLVLAMDAENLRDITAMATAEQRSKVRMFREFDPEAPHPNADVPDPYYGGRNGFETVFSIAQRTASALLDHLEATRS